MGTPIDYPLINGRRHSFASVEIKLANDIYYATAINYHRKRSRTKVRVNHPDPVGKTIGENDYDCDIEMLLAEYNAFQAKLVALAAQQSSPTGYGDVPFNVVVNYTESGLDSVTDTITGGTMDSTEANNQQSTDATKRKFEINPLKIYYNGFDDLGNPLQAPPGG